MEGESPTLSLLKNNNDCKFYFYFYRKLFNTAVWLLFLLPLDSALKIVYLNTSFPNLLAFVDLQKSRKFWTLFLGISSQSINNTRCFELVLVIKIIETIKLVDEIDVACDHVSTPRNC